MASIIYALCALASLVFAGLLFRGYRQSRARMLMWSSACFIAFAVANILLFVDLAIAPGVDLLLLRTGIMLLGLVLLIYGFIYDSD